LLAIWYTTVDYTAVGTSISKGPPRFVSVGDAGKCARLYLLEGCGRKEAGSSLRSN
jgi:hypothetical protein